MPDIPLHEYLSQIEGWIRSGEAGRAVAHGRHVLALYPECVAAHRILGEAYLEKGMLTEARQSFERALEADPEDAIAHIGLSLAYDRQGMLPEAIRQMERAFDVAAGNPAVRADLQALYERRGDSRSSSPVLSRGAMARVYARNGMLERAIAEYQEALRQCPEVPEACAGLAEVQWRAGRAEEAMETCRRTLERAPTCLKALLILGHLLLQQGQQAEGEEALSRAQALDPENHLAVSMMGDASPLLPREVLVSEPDVEEELFLVPVYREDTMQDQEPTAEDANQGAPERVPADEDTPAEQPDNEAMEGEELPEWIEELPPADAPGEGSEESEETEGEPSPAWMEPWNAEAGAGAADEPAPGEAAAGEPEPPPWMKTLAEQPAAEEGTVVPEAGAEEAEAGEATGADAAGPGDGAAPAPIPDWVRRMEEVVTDESLPAGAELLGAATAGTGAAAAGAALGGGSSEERQRIRELTLLLRQEPGKYWARIELARRCCQVADWDGALLQYEELIAGHKMIRAVVADLQGLLDQETDRVQVYRLLGDAYMESDQIDQALEMYRLARQILRKR